MDKLQEELNINLTQSTDDFTFSSFRESFDQKPRECYNSSRRKSKSNELHTYRTNGLKKILKDPLNEATVTPSELIKNSQNIPSLDWMSVYDSLLLF